MITERTSKKECALIFTSLRQILLRIIYRAPHPREQAWDLFLYPTISLFLSRSPGHAR
jgi:hypothetical protein